MKINWFASTALAAILASGAAWAQSSEPQGGREKAAPQAQQERGAKPPTGAAQGAQRNEDRAEPKRGHEPSSAQRSESESKGAPGRAQANEPAAKRDTMSQKGSAPGAEEKRASETKQPESKHPSAQRGSESRNARDEGARQKREEVKQKGQEKGQAKAPEQSPPGQAKGSAETRPGSQSPSTAQGKQPEQSQGAAQSKQSNQSGQTTQQTNTASTKLSETDRSKVVSTLKQERTTSREQINVQVNIGERLPPRIRARPLPATIVQIMPAYRGYEYVTVRDEVMIVRPGTREVVDVIREGGPSYARSQTRSTTVRLTDDQRQVLLREARPMTSAQVSSQGPTCLPMQPVPESLASQNPDLRGFQMLAVGSDVVLIDPKDQKVVDVIHQ
jgi:hypothetical protein